MSHTSVPAKIQGPKFALSLMAESSININSFIHICADKKVVGNFCRCRKMKLLVCENASPVIFHMPAANPSTNFSKTDVLTISKHLWVNCEIPTFMKLVCNSKQIDQRVDSKCVMPPQPPLLPLRS